MSRAPDPERRVRIHTSAPPHRSLVPLERDTVTGRPGRSDRSDKHRHDDASRVGRLRGDPPPTPQGTRPTRSPRPGRRALSVVGAGVAVAAIVTTVFLVTTPSGDQTTGTNPATRAIGGSSAGASASTAAAVAAASEIPLTASTGVVASTRSSIGRSASTASSVPRDAAAMPHSPPPVDPVAIVAYQASATYTRYERPDAIATAHPTVGDVETYRYPCQQGTCRFNLGPPGTTFSAATPRFTGRWAPVNPATGPRPCDIVFRWDLVRQADGSYVGTVIHQPKKLEATFPGGSCRAYAATQHVVMVPVTG